MLKFFEIVFFADLKFKRCREGATKFTYFIHSFLYFCNTRTCSPFCQARRELVLLLVTRISIVFFLLLKLHKKNQKMTKTRTANKPTLVITAFLFYFFCKCGQQPFQLRWLKEKLKENRLKTLSGANRILSNAFDTKTKALLTANFQ